MKKTIKFRGETMMGKQIYCEPFANSETFDFDEFCDAVDFETIAQLVGVDADGAEVYEGDWLVDDFGNETQAELITLPVGRMHLK
ncbi:MAG: hypothetical protein SR3Q1_09045 [Quinella sp. 3Q1]|nr:hypothetical protein [Quinella sp. 3Q1]